MKKDFKYFKDNRSLYQKKIENLLDDCTADAVDYIDSILGEGNEQVVVDFELLWCNWLTPDDIADSVLEDESLEYEDGDCGEAIEMIHDIVLEDFIDCIECELLDLGYNIEKPVADLKSPKYVLLVSRD